MLNYFASQPKDHLPEQSCSSGMLMWSLLALAIAFAVGFGIAIYFEQSDTTWVSPCYSGLVCTDLPALAVEDTARSMTIQLNASVAHAGKWDFYHVDTSSLEIDAQDMAHARQATLKASVRALDTTSVTPAAVCVSLQKENQIPTICGVHEPEITVCGSRQVALGVSGTSNWYPIHYELTLTLTYQHQECSNAPSKFWLWVFVVLLVVGELVLIPLFLFVAYRRYQQANRYSVVSQQATEETPLLGTAGDDASGKV
jgi:hypothetical protein